MDQGSRQASTARRREHARQLMDRRKLFFRADFVESKARALFPDDTASTVLQILSEYQAPSEVLSAQARLAALKLSNGDLKELRIQIHKAKQDFRDVILPAESPGFLRMAMSEWAALSDDAHEKLANEDHEQYMTWIQQNEDASS